MKHFKAQQTQETTTKTMSQQSALRPETMVLLWGSSIIRRSSIILAVRQRRRQELKECGSAKASIHTYDYSYIHILYKYVHIYTHGYRKHERHNFQLENCFVLIFFFFCITLYCLSTFFYYSFSISYWLLSAFSLLLLRAIWPQRVQMRSKER